MKRWLRRLVKWTGATASVLLVVVWIGSAWWCSGVEIDRVAEAGVISGRVYVQWFDPRLGSWAMPEWWDTVRHFETFKWWFEARSTNWGSAGAAHWLTTVSIPIWSLAALTSAPTVLMFWRDLRNRRRAHTCIKCGYDLRGKLAAGCPECGFNREE